MQYGNRKLLKSGPAPEPTAFTMRSIHDILAETGDEGLLQPAEPTSIQSTATAALQPPPSARVIAQCEIAPQAEITPMMDTAAEETPSVALAADVPDEAAKPQSFRQRLASKVFGRT